MSQNGDREAFIFLFFPSHPKLLILCISVQLKGLVVIATRQEKSQKHPKSSNQWNSENEPAVVDELLTVCNKHEFPVPLAFCPCTCICTGVSVWLCNKKMDTWTALYFLTPAFGLSLTIRSYELWSYITSDQDCVSKYWTFSQISASESSSTCIWKINKNNTCERKWPTTERSGSDIEKNVM